ncbi:MAG TPA: flagellar biosynthesis anti-sigma factor FlgM [Leptospiraceae bacterium]|nr:flagellar biosynthesis anti-sigma factor FlgM [Leptospiraceae bacterium]HMW07263.1 flagellar biosynthesis anti-sigma factor FlgM [Leptospiraceae bacterium]HMX34216.1 flagellar biosynthesis anti-sigma factor FlgM [Leptospiraceae bacterium]HMY32919.1 flagellar biosynthesis anti-sigma factor FlgM [Leptospiraceae bacterium]HMZ66068.1 flagellar biosynthesis anti-sigma factor FlgM [Leptospiraceae bacterium]
MFIDKIKNIGSAFEPKKSASVKKSSEILPSDNVQISDAAKLKADIKAITTHTLSLPNSLDIDKINDIKAKLANGYYDNPNAELIEKTADKIADSFLGM